MPEEVLFETEHVQTRAEVATYLRQVADLLESGDAISLQAGTDSVTLAPPARPTFEVTAEREGPAGGPGELSVEFELEWDESTGREDGRTGQLEVE